MLRRGILLTSVALCALLIVIFSRQPERDSIVAMSLSPEGSRVAIGMKSGSAHVLRLSDGQLASEWNAANCSGKWLNAVMLLDAEHLLCSGESLHEVVRDRSVRTFSIPDSGGAYGSAAPLGGNLAVIAASERIFLADRKSGVLEQTLDDHTALYGELRTSEDGKWLAASGHAVHVWRVDGSVVSDKRELAHSYYTFGPIAFAAARMYVGSQDGCVYAWRIPDFTELPRICFKAGTVSSIAVDGNGSLLAVAADRIFVLNSGTGTTIASLPRHARAGVALLPDGTILIANSEKLERWKCVNGTCTAESSWNPTP